MQDVNFDASQLANGTIANNESTDRPNRASTLQKFYASNFGALKAAAHESQKLLFYEADAAVAALSRNLNKYKGPLTEESFLRWANRWVAREAARYTFLTVVITEHSGMIYAAIKDHLWTTAEDLATEPQDIFSEVLMLVFNKAHVLSKKGSAKLSTRLYALTKKHVYLYHNSKNKRRFEAVAKRLQRGGSIDAEQMSEDELAYERAQLSDPDIFVRNAVFVT
jgi:hypothetical protein